MDNLKQKLKDTRKTIKRISKKLQYTEFYEHALLVLNTLKEKEQNLINEITRLELEKGNE